MMRRRHVARLLVAAWMACIPVVAAKAQYATLVADALSFDGRSTLRASGNVEVFYEGQRLKAETLVYNDDTKHLQVLGPITLISKDGDVATATYASLDSELKNGLIKGARVVLQEQMQIAAVEGHRVEGRYTSFYKAVASSCRVCISDPVPLWRIRAEQVVHDEEEKQIHFENAAFEVVGVPILWTPYFRIPDPTLRRASGFLIPSFTSTSELGYGFRFPFFQTLGDHADVTVTPFITTRTRTLELRYRQAFRWGRMQWDGAVSQDDILPNRLRGYVFGRGEVFLDNDFELTFNVELVSDRAYLETYRYSDKDRLSNNVKLTRTRRHEYIFAGFEQLNTLRDSEVPIESTLATNLLYGTYDRRIPYLWGGEARLLVDAQAYEREADALTPALLAACAGAIPPVPVAECLARDVARLTTEAGWARDWTWSNGMIFKIEGQVAGDFYGIDQDTNFPANVNRVTPAGAVQLRWPLARTTRRGGREVLQPVIQLAWAESFGGEPPNEDSRLVEFDEGNALDLSRFPGKDSRETGLRTTIGLTWSHFAPTGREYSIAVAKVFRWEDPNLFFGTSGLDGLASDWLITGRLEFSETLSLQNRTQLDSILDPRKSETRLTYAGERLTAAGSYVWVDASAYEGRARNVSEIAFDVSYEFSRHWVGRADARYDLVAGNATEASIGLGYRNECVNIDLSLSRRFTASTNVAPSTDLGVIVSLNGFGGNDGRPYARQCKHVKG